MEYLAVDTVVYRPASEVFAFLEDFPGYANYSKYLDRVDVLDPGPGETARYALRFEWWKLDYTARSAVVEVDAPRRIEWEVLGDFDAGGRWLVAERELPADAPEWAEDAVSVRFEVEYAPETAHAGLVDLPRLVSFDWVIEKAKPLVEREARTIVERAAADLEGRKRAVDLTVRTGADAADSPFPPEEKA
ncbi:SRPBCC family protein [Halolamina litorea]|uniref:SRPBCC family protein n=1 Tax=Halolamina litorea TaxID=1515593 RepID=A0ABD6BQK1_9EURY|nr:SRPBCC family protein [Halolamina litorea]